MTVRFISPIPSGLTPAQKDVFLKMDRENYFLLTNEGSNYKCWLQKENSQDKIPVNRRTAESLHDKGLIVPSDDFPTKHYYAWKLK